MKYAIIGTGAIGGYYGGRLAQAGCDVHFLLHSDYQYVKDNGLTVDSCDGSFRLAEPAVYRRTSDMPPCDVVIVALKSTANGLLRDMLPPLLHQGTLVMLIQNGIGLEADLQSVFPDLQIAAGLAFICSGKTGPGRINHQSNGMINIGNYSCRDAALVSALRADFAAAGVRTELVEYHEARWKKAVWNMPFNGMTVALDTTTDRLLACPATERLVRELMTEVIGAARACGVAGLDEGFADKMIKMTRLMPPYSPSMKLDYDNHRPMEIGYLYTRPIAEARKVGFAMPKLEMLEAQLLFKDAVEEQCH